MLQDLTQQGYSTEDIKKAVVDTLSPFFDHPEKASLYWTSSELLSVFEFMIRYHYDQEFKDGFSEVLSLYKAAIACDENQTLSIICDTLFDFSQKCRPKAPTMPSLPINLLPMALLPLKY